MPVRYHIWDIEDGKLWPLTAWVVTDYDKACDHYMEAAKLRNKWPFPIDLHIPVSDLPRCR
jgi:hypothetical protein